MHIRNEENRPALCFSPGPAAAFAAALRGTPAIEAFTPAQHDSRWTSTVATLQAECDRLAAAGAAAARPGSLPFPDLCSDLALLYRRGVLLPDIPASFDQLYRVLHPTPPSALPLMALDAATPSGRSWGRLVDQNALSPGALRLAALLRAAPLFPDVPSAPFHCSICGATCTGWGTHLLRECAPLAFALHYGLRRVADLLLGTGYQLQWASATSFVTDSAPGSPRTTWILLTDTDLHPHRRQPHCAYVSWSGLIWAPDSPRITADLHDRLSTSFLAGLEHWLNAPPPARWNIHRMGIRRPPRPLAG
jgi:hypothetical protein